MKRWMMILPLLLVPACIATEGQERLQSPSATSTQVMEVSAADVQVDAEGRYFIPDRGDGCEYYQTTPDATTPVVVEGVVLPERVSLFDPDSPEACPNGWDYEPSTGHLWPLVPSAPAPREESRK